jgi:hypothetical protein
MGNLGGVKFPPGDPPPPLVDLPQAPSGPIARAIWAKVPEEIWKHAGQEMAKHLATMNSRATNPE